MVTKVVDRQIRLHDNGRRFPTEDNPYVGTNGIENRVFDPEDLLKELARRSAARQDLRVMDPSHLNLAWIPDKDDKNGHFQIAPENLPASELRDYLDSHGAIQFEWGDAAHISLCKMMETRPQRYKRLSRDEYHRLFLADVRRWFHPANPANTGMIVRTEEQGIRREILGFVPGNFNTIDEYDIVAEVMCMLDEAGQYVSGVHVLNDPVRMTSAFRLVFGDALPDLDFASGVHCMFDLRYSPIGAESVQSCLGLWRRTCLNAMMRADLSFMKTSWRQFYGGDGSHQQLFNEIRKAVRSVDSFAPLIQAQMHKLPHLGLIEEPRKMLNDLNELKLLPDGHTDLAVARVENNLDGDVRSEWDFLNLLTRSAHDLPSIPARQAGESRAMTMAMQPGAFSGIVYTRRFDHAAAAEDLSALADFEVDVEHN